MNRHDVSGWREQFTETGLNCREALEFYGALVGLLLFILLVLPS